MGYVYPGLMVESSSVPSAGLRFPAFCYHGRDHTSVPSEEARNA